MTTLRDGRQLERPGHAFLWTPTAPNATTGSLQDLSTLGGSHSTAYAINNSGQIAGTATGKAGHLRLVLWTLQGDGTYTAQDLGGSGVAR